MLLTLTFNSQTKVPQIASAKDVTPTQTMKVEVKTLDPRAVILRDYFAKYNSPLEDYAQDFIDASDKYNVDWKLVPSIAGVESTFGQQIPGGFNDWGWGVYGTQAIYFKSQKDGIYTVTQAMRTNYLNRGLTTPYEMNSSYASSGAWGGHVAFFMNDLENFASTYSQYKPAKTVSLNHPNLEFQTISVSAKLTQPQIENAIALK